MKKIAFIIALLLLASGALRAQTKEFMRFYEKYSGLNGYTTIEISGAMLKAMGGNVTVSSDADGGAELMNRMDRMLLVITDTADEGFESDIRRMIEDGGYVRMTAVNDAGVMSRFYFIQTNGRRSEFLMTVTGGGDNVIMSITGDDLDVSQMTRFARKHVGQE